MKKFRLLLLSCLLAALFMATVRAEEAPRNAIKPLAMLPANPAAVLEFPSIPKLFAKGATTGIGRMFKIQGVWDLIEWTRLQMATNPNLNYITVEKAVLSTYRLLTGQVCLAAYLPENQEPYVVMAFETSRTEDEVLAEISTILQYFNIVAGEPEKITAADLGIDNAEGLGKIDLYTISSGFHYYYARGNLFVISTPDTLKHMALVMAGGASFDADALLASLGSSRSKDSIFNAYYSVKAVQSKIVDKKELLASSAIGTDNISWILTTCDIESGLFNEKIEIFTEGGPKGALAIWSNGELGDHNDLVPAHAFASLTQRIDYAALHDLVLKFADIRGGNGDVEALLTEIRDDLKIDLSETIKACIDGDTTSYLMFPPNGFIPDYGVHISLKDTAGVAAALETISKAASLRGSTWKDIPMYWIPPSDVMPYTAGFMVHQDNLVIANGPLGLKNMLLRKPDAKNISSLDAYQRLSARLPKKANEHARAFINIKPLGEKLMPLLSLIQTFDRTAENLVMPIWLDFDPLFSGIYARQYREGDKIVAESTGDIPVISLLSLIVPAGTLYFRSSEIVPDVVIQPTLQGSVDRVPKIYQLLASYAGEHDGEFPASLDAVAKGDNLEIFQSPETMSPIDPNDVDGTSDYYYFKNLTRDDGGIILLANRLPIANGKRVVVFGDGSVKTVAGAELLNLINAYNQRTGMDIIVEDGFIF